MINSLLNDLIIRIPNRRYSRLTIKIPIRYCNWPRLPYVLTHWPLGEMAVILKLLFSNILYRIVAGALAKKLLSLVKATEPHYSWGDTIGSSNVLVPSGNKPTSHYLDQVWRRSLSLHGVTRPQWGKSTLPRHAAMCWNRSISETETDAESYGPLHSW